MNEYIRKVEFTKREESKLEFEIIPIENLFNQLSGTQPSV